MIPKVKKTQNTALDFFSCIVWTGSYRVKILLSMTQYNFRTRLEPNLFSGHFDKAGTILVSRYAHSS